MQAELQQWLAELRNQGVALPNDALGGANENLFCLSLPHGCPVSASDLVAFVVEAVAIRQELVAPLATGPVTFYAWHDEMAGQLRFSTARCTAPSLPFGGPIVLVDHPREIVDEFLASPYRDGIPCSELVECESAEIDADELDTAEPSEPLKVWAHALA
jgi:hypothetical protein